MLSVTLANRRIKNGIHKAQWPVVLLWGLLCVAALPKGSGQCLPCPRVCTCLETPLGSGLCQVDCGQTGLQSFPEPTTLPNPLSSITKLIIKENNIQELPSAFSHLENLVSLDASNNYISSLAENLFYNLTNLEELNLLGNRISNLPIGVFAGLSNLKVLILTRNELVHLQKGIFDDLTSLQVLSINVMPALSTIENGIFSTPNLEKLYINKNSLTELPSNIFKGLPKLRLISLAHNPWSCHCQIYQLTFWLVDRKQLGLRLDYESETVCHDPEFLTSRTIISLQQDELNCLGTPLDPLKRLLFRHHAAHNSNSRSERSVRALFNFRRAASQNFQSSWNNLCRTIKLKISNCKGAEIFSSCGISGSDGEPKLVRFTEATYESGKDQCLQNCFIKGFKFANFRFYICLCGILSDVTCAQSCQSTPADYSTFCGKTYLPQTFSVTAGLSIAPVELLSTGSPSHFNVTTKFDVDHFEWNFSDGDNGTYTTTTGSIEFSYFYPGDYLLTVSAVSDKGAESASIYIKVRDVALQAAIRCQNAVDVSKSDNLFVRIRSGYDLKVSWKRENDSGFQENGLSCEAHWTAHRDRCLQAGVGSLNYTEAAVECRSQGGQLLTLDHLIEIGEIISLFQKTGTAASGYLIGAQKIDSRGVYQWLESDTPSLVITQVKNPDEGDCVTVTKLGLTAVNCDDASSYICQKDGVNCAHGGRLGPDEYCYIIPESPASWDNAVTGCGTYPSGHLAIINSDSLHRFVGYSVLDIDNVQEAWIGLSDRAHDGYFSWVDHVGEASDAVSGTGSRWSSSHTGIDQPEQKDCVMIQKETSSYTWLESDCSQDKRYVCRYSNTAQDVTVGSYAAGTAVFPDMLLTPSVIKPGITLTSQSQTTINLLPGLWFSDSGVLNSWDFVTEDLQTSVSVNFLILRPVCPDGFHLVHPGCYDQGQPFTQCLRTLYNCSGQQRCSTSSQYCSLTNDCLGVRQPCSCASLQATTPGCSQKASPSASQFSQTAPWYDIVKTLRTELSAYSQSRYQIEGQSIGVKYGDVLAYQHDSTQLNPLLCKVDPTSHWRQPVYHWESENWLVNETLEVPANLSKTEDVVCYLRTKFSPPVKDNVPSSLSYFPSPGVYKYSVDITGDIQTKSVSCEVTAQEPISGLTLISPLIVGPRSSSGSVGTVPIEWRVVTPIVLKVSHGSHLRALWTHMARPSGYQFTENCPTELLSSPDCFTNSSAAAKPFSSIQLNLDTNSPISTLSVTVKNDISSDTLTVDLSKAFRIRGLQISLVQTQTHVITGDGEVMVPANENVQFRATFIQGSSVEYVWKVNGVTKYTSQQKNKFTFTFMSPGSKTVQANASNVLGEEMDQLEVTAIQPAKFVNVGFTEFVSLTKPATAVNITVVVDVRIGASVNITIDFGDGDFQSGSVLTDSTTLVWPVSHTYTSTGAYVLNVTFSDLFESVSEVKEIHVINVISDIQVSVQNSVIPLSSKAEFHLVVEGIEVGDVYHTWLFGDGFTMNSSGLNAQISHRFNIPGEHMVNVQASNVIDTKSASVNVTVEEEINGLSLTYNGPKSSQSEILFTIAMSSGSEVKFTVHTGDGKTYNHTSLTFTHLYSQPGVYNVTVTAFNQVSNASAMLVVYALGADMLEVVSIRTPDCTPVGTQVTLTAEVINIAPVSLYYTWEFGDQTKTHKQSTDTVTHRYNSPGIFSIKVSVNNTVKIKSALAEICIQEEILGVRLGTVKPVPLMRGSTVDRTLTATLQAGSNVTYSWMIIDKPPGSSVQTPCYECEESYNSFTFSQAGEYRVSVNASNSVSSVTAETNVRVEEVIETVTLSCIKCIDTIYLEYVNPVTELELSARVNHGTSVEYSWKVDSERPVTSVLNKYTYSLSQVRAYAAFCVASNDVSSVNDSITIIVQEAVSKLHIVVDRTDVVIGQSLTFHAVWTSGSNLTFTWSLCSGCPNATSQSQTYTHTFKVVGEYDVQMRAGNAVSEALATLKVFCLNVIPDVQIRTSLLTSFVQTGDLVDFSASVPQLDRLNITWDIELRDSVVLTGFGMNFSYNFPHIGIYTVFLTVDNPYSRGHSELSITAEEKIINFEIVTRKPVYSVNTEVKFLVTKSAGSDVMYEWKLYTNLSGEWILPSKLDFVNVQLNFPGTKIIKCTASNNVSSAVDAVQFVVQAPISDVKITGADNKFLQSGKMWSFEASVGEGSHLQYTWSVNDTTSPTSHSSLFTHQFTLPGVFLLALQVNNDVSDISLNKTVIVQDGVTDFTLLSTSHFVKTNHPFKLDVSMSAGSDVGCSWVLGDGTRSLNSNCKTIIHRYNSEGVYTIQSTASNNVSSETASFRVTVQDPVEHLHIVDCCDKVYPALDMLKFTAGVSRGSTVKYRQEILDKLGRVICWSNLPKLLCTFVKSGKYTLEVSAKNRVSNASGVYTVVVETVLRDIVVQPEGPGWDYMFQDQPIIFHLSGPGVKDTHTFQWNVNGTVFDTTLPILKHVFSAQGNFSLRVTATNNVSTATYNKLSVVHKFMCEMPIVGIVGSSSRESTPSRKIEFDADLDSRNCTTYTAVHHWQVFTGPCTAISSARVNLPSSVYVKGPLLRIPKQVLSYGTYCVEFVSGYNQTVVKQTIRYSLNLKPSPFVAVIRGGSDVLVSTRQPVALDASLSYDPDINLQNQAHMAYTWNCSSLFLESGIVEDNCFPTKKGKVVQIEEGSFEVDKLYTITLTVSLFNCVTGSDCRTAVTQQKIEISPDPVPTVSIDCLSCRAANNHRLSPSQHVALRGECSDCRRADSVQYLWSVMYVNNNLPSNRGYLVLDSTTTTTGATASDLVIRRGALKHSHSYTFQLDVTKTVRSSRFKGKARLVLGLNEPPSGGTCTLYPKQPRVVPLQSDVTVDCSGWKDRDNPDSDIVYHISVERQLSSGETEQCVIYHGTKMNQTIYVTNWPDSVMSGQVTLRVDVQDDHGASTLALKRNISLLSPVLKPGESLSDHIARVALKHLRRLVKLHRPVALLQYSVAVLMELNRASLIESDQSSSTDRARRAAVREAVTTVLTRIPIESTLDIQQLAYALEQVSMYDSEVQVGNSHLQINSLMKKLLQKVKLKVSQGLASQDFAPRHLLSAASNLMRVVNVHQQTVFSERVLDQQASINLQEFELSWDDNQAFPQYRHGGMDEQRSEIVTEAVGFTETIMSAVLQTKLHSEQMSVINMGNILLTGQRTHPTGIWREKGTAGCQFLLPQSLLTHLPDDEDIFQIMFVMPDNPFTWGYEDNFNITSQVPSLTFQFSNGSKIPVWSLPAHSEMQVLMYGRSAAPSQSEDETFTTMLDMYSQHDLRMSNVTLRAGKSTKVVLDTSMAGDNSMSALHIQVRFMVTSEPETAANQSTTLTVYLGVDYEASEQKHVDKKILTEDMMEQGQDHRQFTFFIASRSFQPKSKYYLSVLNPSADTDMVVSVGMYLSSCQYYNPVTQQWDSQGCGVVDRSTPDVTVCMCNHLTSFGASALVPLDAIDFTDLTRLDVAENPIAVITCSILLALYILLVVICRLRDLQDLKRISKVPLCGTDGSFKYEVTVVTGRQIGAGSTAHVGIKLYGDDGKTGSRHLTKQAAFQRNSQDTFLVAHDTNLGKLWKVLVWHDNAGLSPAWYLIQVVVRDLQTDHRYLFLADCWLSLQQQNGFIQKEIIVADAHQQTKFSRLCWSALSRGMCDQHLWISVFDRPSQSRFSHTQRLTCCFTLLFTYLAVNIMWYGVIKTTPLKAGWGRWSYLSWEEIVVGTVSSLLVFPLNIIIAYIFRKTRCKENMFEYGQKPGTAQTIEMDADCGLSTQGSSVRRGSLRRELAQFYDRESTGDSLEQTFRKPLRRTNTLPKLPSENSQDSLFSQARDSDSGVSSTRLNKGLSSSTEGKGWWSRDSIINHWPVMPEYKCGGEPSKPVKPTSTKKGAVDQSLRISGIQVGDVDSDDGWSSCLDDLDCEETSKETKQKAPTVKSSGELADNGDDWSLDDKEKWKEIEAEIFSEEVPKKGKQSKPHTESSDPPDSKLTAHLEETACFTPRAEAAIATTTTTAYRRRSFSGSVGEVTQNPHPKPVTENRRESSFDRASVEANILFGRERDKTVSSISTRRGTLRGRKLSAASRLSHRLTRMLLPHWCLYVAYTLCVLISAVSVCLVLLYANQLGSEGTWRWIVSLVMSFLLSAFLTEPLKVIFLAIFVAAVTKQIDEVEDDDAIEVQPMIETNERLKDVRFRPLGGYALLQAKEDAKKLARMHTLIRQFVAYFCLLWLVVIISHVKFSPHLYRLSEQARREYVLTAFNGSKTFEQIDSIPSFWKWSSEVLTSRLYETGETANIVLGPARLKQTRSVLKTCLATKYLSISDMTGLNQGQCDGSPEFTEDTGSYGVGWIQASNTTGSWDNISTTAWTYSTAEDLQEYGVTGVVSWYSAGGYVQTLATSQNETLDILNQLKDTDWINLRTRAVFVELTMWNPALDITSVVLLTVEFSVSGKAVTSVDIESCKLERLSATYVDALLICQIILLIVSVYFVVQCVLTVKSHGWSTFTNKSHVVEIVMTVLMLTSGCLYIVCVIMSAETISQYLSDRTGFISFRKTVFVHWWRRLVNTLLGFLLLLKIVQQMRFSKSMSVFEKTLSSACWKIIGAFLLFTVLLCTYAHLGYLLFGRAVFGYHTFQSSLVSVVGVIRGDVDYSPLIRLHPVWSHLYLYSLGLCLYGLIVALVTAVLLDVYKLSHSQMFYKLTLDIHDYEMIDFMLRRFKQWAGIIKPKAAFKKVKFAGYPSLSSHSTVSNPSSHSLGLSSSSSDYYGLDRFDSTLSAGHCSKLHLDQLPARWEDVLMKMRQLEEMDRHEDRISQRISAVITERKPDSSFNGDEGAQNTSAAKPPKWPRARSMSDSKSLSIISSRGTKNGRQSASPPSSGKQPLGKRPHSDQGARAEHDSENSTTKTGILTRFFKKAW